MKGWRAWCAAGALLVAAPAAAGEYVIGGGDTLQVNVWKSPELSQSVVVRPDGNITLPLIGDVRAEGMTAMGLGKALAQKISVYVNAPNVTVTVSSPTSYKVYTQGAVAPGVHVLLTPVTARQLLLKAGGPMPDADLAHAYLLRGDSRIPADLTTSVLEPGSPSADPLLAPGDILVVPGRGARRGRILVVGEVVQPRARPYVDGMTVLDAFLDAGGGTPAADLKRARIMREKENGDLVEIPVDLYELVKLGAVQKNQALLPGDSLVVPFQERAERVLLIGEVRSQRSIAYREGLTLLDAFVEGGGGTDYADLDSVRVIRTTAEGKTQELKVDLKRILKKGDLSRNLPLAPGDVIMVPQ